jgi:hypothetical protein
MPAGLCHANGAILRCGGCDTLAASCAEQGVGGGAARPFAVDLGLGPGDFRLQDLDTLLKFGHAEQLEVLAHRFDKALAATNADFRRLFHDRLCLSGFPMGRYPTPQGGSVQVYAEAACTALPEPST